jgi:hypothetical protein
MSSTIRQIRKALDVQPTRDNKGLTATFKVTAYDNGLVTLNRTPMGHKQPRSDREAAVGLLASHEAIAAQLTEFYQLVQQRRG